MVAPPLALTMGDPAGIGGELTLRAWRALRETGPCFFVLDDPARLCALAESLGFDANAIHAIHTPRDAARIFPRALPVLPVSLDAPVVAGCPDPTHAPAVMRSVETGARLALAGDAAGLVTNPISKASLYAAGLTYPGHTEWLCALTGAAHAVMMLVCPVLRVVPVTVHVALRDVAALLRTDRIVLAGRVVAAALRQDFGIAAPRLVVAGLNPHAGEHGAMGDEESRLIAPAVEALRAEGLAVTGPHPPDSLFSAAARAGYDAVICMYHDQALIPLKTLDMAHGVNVTLGLPIIRTSPDHGTAFDIAGRGLADPASLIAALELAGGMAQRRAQG